MIFHALCYKMAIDPRIAFPYLSFSMPWFFYKSGMFFSTKNQKELFYKDKNKYIKQYIIWVIIGLIIWYLALAINHSISFRNLFYTPARRLFLTGSTFENNAMWFLLSLFITRELSNVLLKKFHPIVIMIAGYTLGILTHIFEFDLLPYWFRNIGPGICFFSAGYFLHKYESNKIVLTCSMLVYILLAIMEFPIVALMDNRLIQGNYYLWMPCAICCIVAFNNFCRILQKILTKVWNISFEFFHYISEGAMVFYAAHMAIITLVINVSGSLCPIILNHPLISILIGYILLLPLINKVYKVYGNI